MVHLSGRFDLNVEFTNPALDSGVRQGELKNYHKFLFLKVTPNDRITLDAEILDLSYYEIRYRFDKGIELAFGKIWVPFGASPFHHYYGARQGDPFQGLFLPNVWSEFGATIGGQLYQGDQLGIASDVFVIRGFDTELGTVLRFANGGTDGLFAVGQRTKISVGKLSFWGSALYSQFGQDTEGEVVLWGGDVLADYRLIDVPFLRDLQFRAAFARAEIRDEVLVSPTNSEDSWYYRYGDYAELTYRGLPHVRTRIRYGTIIDFDDVVTNRDSHNWDFALLGRLNPNLLVMAEWQINLEEVNEVDDDLFRLQLVFEF